MKKFVVSFVALTFLATLTLIGCNKLQESPEPAAPPAAVQGEPGPAGAPGAPGAPGEPAPATEK